MSSRNRCNLICLPFVDLATFCFEDYEKGMPFLSSECTLYTVVFIILHLFVNVVYICICYILIYFVDFLFCQLIDLTTDFELGKVGTECLR